MTVPLSGAPAEAKLPAGSLKHFRAATMAATLVLVSLAALGLGSGALRAGPETEAEDAPLRVPPDALAASSAKFGIDPGPQAVGIAASALGDPFDFRCPFKTSNGERDVEACCSLYRGAWPYQFPQCSKASCETCWRETHNPMGLPGLGLVGVAYAAMTMIYVTKPLEFETSGRMTRTMLAGLRSRTDVDVCPRVSDWTVQNAKVEADDSEIRLYQSWEKKIAVLSFRGSESDSIANWVEDFEVRTEEVTLPDGSVAHVHRGFLAVARGLKDRAKEWMGSVPHDWTLILTGHSLGAAVGQIIASFAAIEDWERRPDSIIAFGTPRFTDGPLAAYWQSAGLCDQALRVTVYNDLVPHVPFGRMFDHYQNFVDCVGDLRGCFGKQYEGMGDDVSGVAFNSTWTHLCPASELVVPGAVQGINDELEDSSVLGGILAHLSDNCLYGYAYGVLHMASMLDTVCGISSSICPTVACEPEADLRGVQCYGLDLDRQLAADPEECRRRCCDDPDCRIWQLDSGGKCWRGRDDDTCDPVGHWANHFVAGQRIM